VFNVEIVEGKMRLFGEVHAAGNKTTDVSQYKQQQTG